MGIGAAASKTYHLGAHSALRLKVSLWKLDSWDGEVLFIKIDGAFVWKKNINFDVPGVPRCGNNDFFW